MVHSPGASSARSTVAPVVGPPPSASSWPGPSPRCSSRPAVRRAATGRSRSPRRRLRPRRPRRRRPRRRQRRRPRAVEPPPAPSAAPTAAPSPVGGWSFVKQEPCPESRFECVTLAVPSDHFAAGSATWDVTFAIERAKGPRVGTYVVITGGPGTSGILAADCYADFYPASFAEHMDIVFFDQRGIGLSRPFQCRRGERGVLPQHRPIPRTAAKPRRRAGRPQPTSRLPRRGRRPGGGPAAVLDGTGRGGPRGDPAVPGRRQAGPVRRELRDAVRPDVRRAVSRAHQDPLPRRPC